MDPVQAVRRFNRFYTRRIGLLEDHLPSSVLSLPEGRIVYELAAGDARTAAALSRTLDMDKAQLSRLLVRLADKGLVEARGDPANARRKILSLTGAGESAFASMDEGARENTRAMLDRVPPARLDRMIHAMREIETAIDNAPVAPSPITLRPPVVGDMGWIIHRQAVLYGREYGWDWTYEALIAKILGEFAAGFDPVREAAWIADQEGRTVGSIFLMRGDAPDEARLRLLYVEPSARGSGLGRRLVNICIENARERGYARLTLWTNDVLTSARRIYEAAGFRLVEESPHHSFGMDLTGQTWTLELRAP
jgi:DNA-binding MarR family transcriptional regulator/GNAT superfamily N-acetyltransferase